MTKKGYAGRKSITHETRSTAKKLQRIGQASGNRTVTYDHSTMSIMRLTRCFKPF